MNRKYELLILLQPTLKKEDLEKLIKEIESKLSGKIVERNNWGLKTLAYKIKHKTEAYYLHYYLETTSEAIMEFKKFSLIEKKIMRQIILRHENKWPFEMKTTKDLKFPERRERNDGFNKKIMKNKQSFVKQKTDKTGEEKND